MYDNLAIGIIGGLFIATMIYFASEYVDDKYMEGYGKGACHSTMRLSGHKGDCEATVTRRDGKTDVKIIINK